MAKAKKARPAKIRTARERVTVKASEIENVAPADVEAEPTTEGKRAAAEATFADADRKAAPDFEEVRVGQQVRGY